MYFVTSHPHKLVVLKHLKEKTKQKNKTNNNKTYPTLGFFSPERKPYLVSVRSRGERLERALGSPQHELSSQKAHV